MVSKDIRELYGLSTYYAYLQYVWSGSLVIVNTANVSNFCR